MGSRRQQLTVLYRMRLRIIVRGRRGSACGPAGAGGSFCLLAALCECVGSSSKDRERQRRGDRRSGHNREREAECG